jgi:phage-related protein
MDGVIQDIKAFIISIPDRIVKGIGTIGNWIDTIFNAIFGQDQAKAAAKETGAKETEKTKANEQLLSEFDQFIQGIITSCKEWFNDLPNKIQNGMKSIGDFFGRVISALDEFFFGKKVTHTEVARQAGTKNKNHIVKYTTVTTRYKTGFSKWLDDVIKDVKKFILNIPNYIKAGIKGAGDIISTFEERFDEHSPSKVSEGQGYNYGLGMANGLDDSLAEVSRAVSSIADTIILNCFCFMYNTLTQ